MSSLDPASQSIPLSEPKAAKPVPPAVRIAKDFIESPLAVLGLAILSFIILVAVFAPLIAPQNPYDLSEIRLEDSRQPPGSQRTTDPWEADLALAIDPNVEGRTEITFAEEAPVDSAVLSWTPLADEATVAIGLTFDPPLDGIPLEPLRLDDLPRGAELNIGEKHSFRSFWTVDAAELEDFTLTSRRALDRPFELELVVKATEGEALMTYWLGTDGQGRDMLSAIMYGLRTSLAVGVVSCFFAMLIGLSLGMIAAFFGGRIETVIMRIVDLQLSFPTILVALMLLAILGSGVEKVMLALIIVQWAYFARTARSVALVERGKEYMEAAQCLALSKARVIFRHLLPNCLPPIIVVATVQVANAIALEATLSFLGIGLPVTEPSLGLLISNGFEFMLSGRYWISMYPGIALLLTIIAINLVGDRLRDVLNPRLNR
ncbi:peptide/nickel transport system permease protein [Litoreibacter ponti]|uniref:Peptide/nickel transport system permease protein n=1 Tax=Litoreibacter ponti TaxID=1510457 RepID=A0A2T6BK12_9RHOB|nr:peptide/nickel transport system permease protein [Litoreibacter ponti]